MDKDSKRQKRRDDALSLLGVAIQAMDLAKEFSSPTPAKAVFGTVSVLLTMIRVRLSPFRNDGPGFTRIQDFMSNDTDYVDLGLACAEICEVLKRGTDGRELDDLSQSVREAIARLKTWADLSTPSR